MPDLSQALAVLRSMRMPMSPEVSALGTGRGRGNALNAKRVPVVPDVPAQSEAMKATRRRSLPAIVEFCDGPHAALLTMYGRPLHN